MKNIEQWDTILRLDVGKEPKKKELNYDGRLSGFLPWNDGMSTATFRKRSDGHWKLRIDNENIRILRYLPNSVMYLNVPTQILFTGAARLLTHQIWWPKEEPLESFLYRQASVKSVNIANRTVWNSPSLHYGKSDFNIGVDQVEKLKMREADMLTWFLIGATADPYRWVPYANSIGILQQTKLGHILTLNVREALLLSECNSVSHGDILKQLVRDFPNQVIVSLGRDYRDHFSSFDPKYIGPLQIIRNLIAIHALPSATPITIATFLDLVNPVTYLESQQASVNHQELVEWFYD